MSGKLNDIDSPMDVEGYGVCNGFTMILFIFCYLMPDGYTLHWSMGRPDPSKD